MRTQAVTLLFLLLTACSGNNAPIVEKAKVEKFYDLQGLISDQVATLSRDKPTITKNVSIAGKEETYVGQEIDWEKELTLFMESDINKPTLISQYEINEYINQDGDSVLEYQQIDEKASGVLKMKITKSNQSNHPQMITIETRKNNALFASSVNMKLQLGKEETPRIESYEIQGFEKILLKDTLTFSIHGNLN